MSDITKKTTTDKFACPSCGGIMEFDPKTQNLKCPFCSNTVFVENVAREIKEYDINSAEKNANYNWGDEKRVIKCNGCGAETLLDTEKTAEFCAFCGSSHIVKNENQDTIAPETVIPFKIDKNRAVDMFKEWIKKRFFAPSALKKSHTLNKISGVYIPYWTYDSDTYSQYTGERGTYYYVTEYRTVTDAEGRQKQVAEQVRKTRWEWTSGNYSEYFDDVLVTASTNLDHGIIKRIEPFDLGELISYKPEYLSGFLAERYTVNLQEGWGKASEVIKSKIYSGIVAQIGGDEVRGVNFTTDHRNVKFKHILLPLWISSYVFKSKVYNFLINGQTGKVGGRAPVSVVKVIGLILGIVAGGFALYYLFNSIAAAFGG